MPHIHDDIKPVTTIAVIGGGNVATHLLKAFTPIAQVHAVNPRTFEGMPATCDVALISVKDDAVAEVASRIEGKACVVAHTSGSIPASALANAAKRYGVFYPMQTFSKDVALDYSTIPFFIEGCDRQTEEILTDLARRISSNVTVADSTTRKRLHLAAVFACNFTNRLIGIADEILNECGLDYKAMLPLLEQTVDKLHKLSPSEAQTGPAVRNDFKVINAHLEMLDSKPRLRTLYQELTSQIIEIASHKDGSGACNNVPSITPGI